MSNNQSKKGAVLLYVIMIFCLMTILGTGMIFLANHNTKMTKIEMNGEQVYQSALSGLETTLDAFTKDAVTGKAVVDQIRASGGILPLSLDGYDSTKMGSIEVTVACATNDASTCTKLVVNSTATLNGLTRTVTGYINIIEGGIDKPLVVVNVPDIDANGKNTQVCGFGWKPGKEDDCKFGKDIEKEFQQPGSKPNIDTYKKYVTQLTSNITKDCNYNNNVNKKSCNYKDRYSANMTFDISGGTIYVNIANQIENLSPLNITVKGGETDNLLVFLFNELSIKQGSIGKIEDADNIVFMAKGEGDIDLDAEQGAITMNAWILAPFSEVDAEGSNANIYINLYGGLIANKLEYGKFANLFGVKPSANLLNLISEAGINVGGGSGGAMSFGKTYDK